SVAVSAGLAVLVLNCPRSKRYTLAFLVLTYSRLLGPLPKTRYQLLQAASGTSASLQLVVVPTSWKAATAGYTVVKLPSGMGISASRRGSASGLVMSKTT